MTMTKMRNDPTATKGTNLNERASKALSYFLRHSIDFVDKDNWAETDKIVEKIASQFDGFTADILKQIVTEDGKKRYCLDCSGTKIRANYGHSNNLRLKLEAISDEDAVPEVLYHGTATRFLPSIMEQGLLPMTRSYVHLSTDADIAFQVGKRHGKPIVLCIDAKQMVRDGHSLYYKDGLWFADAVPAKYLKKLPNSEWKKEKYQCSEQ